MKSRSGRKRGRVGLLLGGTMASLLLASLVACEPDEGFDYWQYVEPAGEHEDEHHEDEHDGGVHDGGMHDGGMDGGMGDGGM